MFSPEFAIVNGSRQAASAQMSVLTAPVIVSPGITPILNVI